MSIKRIIRYSVTKQNKRPQISNEYKRLVRSVYQNKCAYCGTHLDSDEGEIDHQVPVAHGGNSTIFNLCLACMQCNREKGVDDWGEKFTPPNPLFHAIGIWTYFDKYIKKEHII